VGDRVPHAPRQRDLRRGARGDEALVDLLRAVADRVRVRPARVLVVVHGDQEVEAGRAAALLKVSADLVAHGTVARDREAQTLGCYAHLWDAAAAQLPEDGAHGVLVVRVAVGLRLSRCGGPSSHRFALVVSTSKIEGPMRVSGRTVREGAQRRSGGAVQRWKGSVVVRTTRTIN